jgi:prevent-host-death family protein
MIKRPYRASNVWTMTEARAKLSEIIDRAIQYGPQLITYYGKPRAYVVSKEDWRRRQAGLPLVHEEQEVAS